jgi:hypothetical protein
MIGSITKMENKGEYALLEVVVYYNEKQEKDVRDLKLGRISFVQKEI